MTKKGASILIGTGAVVLLLAAAAVAFIYTGGLGGDAEERAQIIRARLAERAATVAYENPQSGIDSDLTLDNLRLTFEQGGQLTAERLTVQEYDWENPEQPNFLDIRVRAMRLIAPQGQAAESLSPFMRSGLMTGELTTDARVRYRQDPEARTLEIEQSSETDGVGDTRFFLKVGNWSPQNIDLENQENAGRIALQLTLVRMEVRFEDRGLMERLHQARGQEENISAEEAKARTLNELLRERNQADNDLSREMLDAAIQFVQNPGTFRVAAEPEAPFPMMGMMLLLGDPDRLKRQLGLTVEVTQGN